MRRSFAFLGVLSLVVFFAAESCAQGPGGGGCRQPGGQSPGQSPSMMSGATAMSGGSMLGGMSSYQQTQLSYMRQMEQAYRLQQMQQAYLQQNSQYQQAALRDKDSADAQQQRLEARKAAAREKRQAAEAARREKAKERNAQLPKVQKRDKLPSS